MSKAKPVTYKAAVQRLLNMGVDLEDLMLRMISHESKLTSGYRERHWYAVVSIDGTAQLNVVSHYTPLSFRVQDLAKYRSLLRPDIKV